MMDTRAALLRGGDSGGAIVPGSPDKSLLIKAIEYRDKNLQMPPKGKLADQVIADFRKWVAMGAPDPRVPKMQPPVKSKIDVAKGRKFWAYRLPTKAPLPIVEYKTWPRTDIDHFILAQLESNKLAPVEDADAHTLVRRLHYVITGLPPSPKDVKHWTAQLENNSTTASRQEAVAKLVDTLLKSPRYGEHWGRHWMDVARFAESTGGDANNILPHAWRYRDYVIDAFNSDKPFDRFIMEQIAGDLLPIADDKEWGNNVVATGFLAVGVKLVAERDDRKFFADMVDEQIDATTRAFLATTVACARCHDHKYDPIPQQDYYALAGIFRSIKTHFGLIKAQARQVEPLLDLTGMGLPVTKSSLSKKEFERLRTERDAAHRKMDDILMKIRSKIHVKRSVLLRARTVRDRTQGALKAYDENGNPRSFAMGTQDREFPVPTRLLIRGELDKPSQIIPRGFVQVLSKPGEHLLPITAKGSGRIQLAEWIASPNNPLTARVMVNRIWHHLFGRGIVRTVDDFGKTGELPTHPKLLDYLAIRLMEHKWSVKALIREIVLSRTWQLSSSFDKGNYAIDPDNRFLWRMNRRRLEGEAVRDAMLAVSGHLEKQRPLGTLLVKVGEGTIGRAVYEPEIRKLSSNHRSVYLPRVRNVLPEILELFDAPDASLVMGARETTTSPLQALYLMNNPFVQKQADGFAERIMQHPQEDRIPFAYQLAFGRSPTANERKHAAAFAARFRKLAAKQELVGEEVERELYAAYCQALMCTAEFRIID